MSQVSIPHPPLTAKDFATDQEVRWCPGCGDYSILAQVQKVMPTIGVPRENIVIISGIGCSSRFPQMCPRGGEIHMLKDWFEWKPFARQYLYHVVPLLERGESIDMLQKKILAL